MRYLFFLSVACLVGLPVAEMPCAVSETASPLCPGRGCNKKNGDQEHDPEPATGRPRHQLDSKKHLQTSEPLKPFRLIHWTVYEVREFYERILLTHTLHSFNKVPWHAELEFTFSEIASPPSIADFSYSRAPTGEAGKS